MHNACLIPEADRFSPKSIMTARPAVKRVEEAAEASEGFRLRADRLAVRDLGLDKACLRRKRAA